MRETMKTAKHFLAYFDMLGYKQQIQELGDDLFLNIISKAIDKMQRQLREENRLFNFLGLKTELLQVNQFSDNFTVSIRSFGDPASELFSLMTLISFVSRIQSYLFSKLNILIRGAIVKGPFYRDLNFVYGSALVEACRLEEEVAIYPRIIVTKPCRDIFKKRDEAIECLGLEDIELKSEAIAGVIDNFCRHNLYFCEDGQWAVHYLNVFQTEFISELIETIESISPPEIQNLIAQFPGELRERERDAFRSRLKRSRNNILEGMDKTGGDRASIKFLWLANYYNATCAGCGFFDEQIVSDSIRLFDENGI